MTQIKIMESNLFSLLFLVKGDQMNKGQSMIIPMAKFSSDEITVCSRCEQVNEDQLWIIPMSTFSRDKNTVYLLKSVPLILQNMVSD